MNAQVTTRDGSTVTTAAVAQLCEWCGVVHSGVCPKVKAIEYHLNGGIKRVEFK